MKQEGSGPFENFSADDGTCSNWASRRCPCSAAKSSASILAHEYGHFSHNDTFYSRFIFQVSASLATSLAVMSAAGGCFELHQSVLRLLVVFFRAYTLLANGFSRSREFLADRQAVGAYGKTAFVSGLTKVSVDGAMFDSIICENISRAAQSREKPSPMPSAPSATGANRPRRSIRGRDSSRNCGKRSPGGWTRIPLFRSASPPSPTFRTRHRGQRKHAAIELISEHETLEAKLTGMLTSLVHDRLSLSVSH